MEEYNKKTLIEALSTLPEHEPSASLWEAIEAEMKSSEATPYTRTQLHLLPRYEPSGRVWANIERKLAAKPGQIFLLGGRKWLAVAASLALLLLAYWQFGQKTLAADDAVVEYSVETADDLLINHDWDEDEDAFDAFREICEAKKYICDHPEFQSLQSELEELTEAKEALREAIGSYGTEPELVLQIKEIELERTDLLKKMMVMLI